MHPEPVLTPEIEIEAGLRNVETAIASTLRPVAMLASPLMSTIPLPCALSLPRALLLPPALLLPRDCLLLRTLRLLLLSLLGPLLRLLFLSLLGSLLLRLLLLSLLGPLLRLLFLSLLGSLLLRLLFLSLLGSLLLRLLLLSLLGPLLLRLLLLSLLGPLLLRLLLLSLLGPLLLRLLLLGLLGPLLLLRLLLLGLLGPLLLLRLLLLSLLGPLLLLRSLLLRLLGPLLLLRLCLRARLLIVFFLSVHRDKRPKKQKQGNRVGNSNELHSNRLLKVAIGCARGRPVRHNLCSTASAASASALVLCTVPSGVVGRRIERIQSWRCGLRRIDHVRARFRRNDDRFPSHTGRSCVSLKTRLACDVRSARTGRGGGFLFLGFVSHVFCRLLGRRLAAIRDRRWQPFHRLVRRSIIGGGFRSGRNIPGASVS